MTDEKKTYISDAVFRSACEQAQQAQEAHEQGRIDDEVRFATVEALDEVGEMDAREPLLAALTNDEEDSVRVKHRILEALQKNGWEVKGFRKAVEELLPDGWFLDRAGKIKILDKHRPDDEDA